MMIAIVCTQGDVGVSYLTPARNVGGVILLTPANAQINYQETEEGVDSYVVETTSALTLDAVKAQGQKYENTRLYLHYN